MTNGVVQGGTGGCLDDLAWELGHAFVIRHFKAGAPFFSSWFQDSGRSPALGMT
jgi:hypothetical protein